MFRLNDAGQDQARWSRVKSRVSRAIVVPALAWATLSTARVSSVSVQPLDMASGGSATGTVRVEDQAGTKGAVSTVTLTRSSSNLTIPATVQVSRLVGSATFSVSARSGSAGCPTISAQVGVTPPKSVMVFVQPPPTLPSSRVKLTLSGATILGVPGAGSITGTVSLVSTTSNGLVQLTNTNPSIVVPASVTVPMQANESGIYAGSTTFPITVASTANSQSCTVITATGGSDQSRQLLKIASGLFG